MGNRREGLSQKQEKYVQGLVAGLSQRKAYKEAYDCTNYTNDQVDRKAHQLFAKEIIKDRYKELIEEHKQKALYTRQNAVEDLIWLKEQAKEDIKQKGVRQGNGTIFVNAVKELCQLEDLYPDKKDKDKQNQENNVAGALRDLIDEIKEDKK